MRWNRAAAKRARRRRATITPAMTAVCDLLCVTTAAAVFVAELDEVAVDELLLRDEELEPVVEAGTLAVSDMLAASDMATVVTLK
jgi:hypothetical protein